MKVLVVEDERAARRRGPARARGRGHRGRRHARRRRRPVGGDRERLRRDRARPHAARAQRARRPGRACASAGVWTPVLVLTARDGDEVQVGAVRPRCRRLPGQAVLVRRPPGAAARPRAPGRARASGRAARRRPAPRAGPASGVARGGDEIALTPREYGVLELLHAPRRRRGDQVARSWRTCGTRAFDGDPNVVEVYISYLRRKVDAPFGRRVDRDRPGAWATGSRPTG